MKKSALCLLALMLTWAHAPLPKAEYNVCRDTLNSNANPVFCSPAAYATAFRDLLASSPRFVEYPNEMEILNGKVHVNWDISVISVDPSVGSVGNSTVLSVVLLVGGTAFITQLAQSCPRAEVKNCAADTLSLLDPQIGKGPAHQLQVRDLDYISQP